VGQRRQVAQVEHVAGEVLDVADADGRGGRVHALGDLVHVEAVRVVQHADQPDLAAGVLGDAVPGVGDAGEVGLRGHHILTAAGPQPPGHLVQGLGEAGGDRDRVRAGPEQRRGAVTGVVQHGDLGVLVHAGGPGLRQLELEPVRGGHDRGRHQARGGGIEVGEPVQDGEVLAAQPGHGHGLTPFACRQRLAGLPDNLAM